MEGKTAPKPCSHADLERIGFDEDAGKLEYRCSSPNCGETVWKPIPQRSAPTHHVPWKPKAKAREDLPEDMRREIALMGGG